MGPEAHTGSLDAGKEGLLLPWPLGVRVHAATAASLETFVSQCLLLSLALPLAVFLSLPLPRPVFFPLLL